MLPTNINRSTDLTAAMRQVSFLPAGGLLVIYAGELTDGYHQWYISRVIASDNCRALVRFGDRNAIVNTRLCNARKECLEYVIVDKTWLDSNNLSDGEELGETYTVTAVDIESGCKAVLEVLENEC